MAVLYVTEQGAAIRRRGRTLVVEKQGTPLAEVEGHTLEAVLIFGTAQLTTPAISFLLNEGIEAAFLTRDGRLKGQLTPVKARNILLRVAQFERARQPEFCLRLARAIVAGKIANALAGLRRFRNNHPEAPLGAAIAHLENAQREVAHAPSRETLLGLEGSAARAYFNAFSCMCLGPLPFPGRRRRPPTDPVNALLSLGYTLVVSELQSLLDARGFDPYLGFLHGIQYGRPSLALDLLEEFRYPLVDRFTLYLNNKGILAPEDFEEAAPESEAAATPDQAASSDERAEAAPDPPQGIRLTRDGLRKYLTAWEDWLSRPALDEATGDRVHYREIFRRQAERLARAIREDVAYVPHRFVP